MKRCVLHQGSWLLVWSALLSGTAACSDDNATVIARPPDGSGEAGAAAVPGEPSGAAPVYVAFVGVPAVEGYSFYATTVRALDGSTVSLDNAIEIPGDRGNRMYVNGTSVFIGEAESVNIVRYDVARDGRLTPGDRFSLAQLGASPGNVNLFAAEDRAYLVDQWGPAGLQIVKWNPTLMQTTGTLDVPEVASSDYIDFDVQEAVRWGKYFAIPYSLKNWDEYEVEPQSTVLLIDVETEEVRVVSAPGCSYTTSAVVGSDGDLYLASSSFAYLFKQFDPSLPTNCVARVRASDLSIDETYTLDLTSATAGRSAGDLAYTPGREGYTLSFYPEETDPFDPANPFAIFDANAWRPWAIDLEAGTGRELDFPLASASLGMLTVDEKPYRTVALADGTTEVYEVPSEGAPRLALRLPGTVYVLARIY